MFDLGKALENLGTKLCNGEAEMLASAHTLIAHIHDTIAKVEAQPAAIRADIAKAHDALLNDIMSWCAKHLRTAPAENPTQPASALLIQKGSTEQAATTGSSTSQASTGTQAPSGDATAAVAQQTTSTSANSSTGSQAASTTTGVAPASPLTATGGQLFASGSGASA